MPTRSAGKPLAGVAVFWEGFGLGHLGFLLVGLMMRFEMGMLCG